MSADLKIETSKLKKYDNKQPEHEILPRVPFRFTMIAPTYSGKNRANFKYHHEAL